MPAVEGDDQGVLRGEWSLARRLEQVVRADSNATMTGPTWARWVFALVFAGMAGYCVARLLAARLLASAARTADESAADSAHLLMAAGMTVMFLPVATPVPPVWWAVGFGLHSAWLAVRLGWPARTARSLTGLPRGRAHLITHLLASVVMSAMFAVLPADGLSGSGVSHAGHLAASSAVFAVAGWLSAAYFLGHALHCGVRVAVPRDSGPPGASEPANGVLAVTLGTDLPLRLVMGVGMSYMLLTML